MNHHFYLTFVLALFMGLVGPVSAQYTWENHGPDNIGSATRALAFFDDGNGLLAGSQGGSLWRSTSQGQTWERVASYTGNPHISSIEVEGNTIYVGTGTARFRSTDKQNRFGEPVDYDYRSDRANYVGNLRGKPGAGVYVSTDNGATWSNQNATTSGTLGAGTLNYEGPFTDVLKVEAQDEHVLVATVEGLYYSNDRLQSLQPVQGPAFLQENAIYDVEFAADGRVFASAHRTGPRQTDSVYVSTNQGRSFTPFVDEFLYQPGGLLNANASLRTELAVAPSNPNILYLASTLASGEVAGVVRHDLSRNSWRRVAPVGGQGFNPLGGAASNVFVLEVSPADENALILAGERWFTYTDETSWNQTAQHVNPATNSYLPAPIYAVAFDPNDPRTFWVGTQGAITASFDGGETFAPRSKGYESTVTLTVSSLAYQLVGGEEPERYDAVMGGSLNHGVLYNGKYNTEQPNLQPARQGFGQISNTNFTPIVASLLHPGSLVVQGGDGGLLRSLNLGEIYETFYGLPILPQVANLQPANSDTIIDRTDANDEGGGTLRNVPTPAQVVFALDEYIPTDLADAWMAPDADVSVKEAQEQVPSYLFFCSSNYVWIVNNPFGDLLQTRWNRLTASLVDGRDEVFTAMTVAQNEDHTVFVGTSQGNLFRLDRPHDLANFDAQENVVKLTENFNAANLGFMEGRAITDLALDPADPNRLVVTYAGYADTRSVLQGWPHITYNARDSIPQFGAVQMRDQGRPQAYAAQFVQDEGESVLLLGTENGLYSLRNFSELLPSRSVRADITLELPQTAVYDIYQRPYRVVINSDALTRTVEVEVPVGDTVKVEEREVEVDQFRLEADGKVYLATYGQGFWSTNSLNARLGPPQPGPAPAVASFSSRLYPNPSRGKAPQLELELPEDAQVQVRILALDGREVWRASQSWEAGRQTRALDLPARLSSGLYLVSLTVRSAHERFAAQHKLLWSKP